MATKPKAIFCWSGGKDSAYCLNKVLTEHSYEVCYLLTTVNDTYKRISMHGVREELLQQQTEAIGIPQLIVRVSEGTNGEYERQMEATLLLAKAEGINHVIFGDIFLEDLRAYREANLAKVGMIAVFPLWKMDTSFLIKDFVDKGFKTVLCCTNDAWLGEEWAGRVVDESFINEIPDTIDPCGENGEFHSFCYGGPVFNHEIAYTVGEKVYKPLDIKTTGDGQTNGFWFCDLIPA